MIKVAVAGGSIAGLCAGIALRAVGCDVDIYGRAPGPMSSRGAGIVAQDQLLHLLRQHGAPELPTVACPYRRHLLPDGAEGARTAMPLRFTSWSAIYATLRSAFPTERYHHGTTLAEFAQANGRVLARFAERAEVEADLL